MNKKSIMGDVIMEIEKKIILNEKERLTILRARMLIMYYKELNKCYNCDKLIEVKVGESIELAKKRKFCSHSCAASYNRLVKSVVTIDEEQETNTNITND